MDGGPLGKSRTAKAPRGEDNLLLDSNRSNHQVLAVHIQSHETHGWRRSAFCEHLILLLSALRKQSGWMRRVMRACGKSLTKTSLTTRVISVQVCGRATKQRDGLSVPCAYHGQPRHHAPRRRPRHSNTRKVARGGPHDNILTTSCPFS